jgi:predicted phosphohydrolase
MVGARRLGAGRRRHVVGPRPRRGEARPRLARARPGQKILIKGNHCTWWQSRSKVEKVLHPSIRLLQNNA